jgi:uncharacterized protein YukE
VRRLAALLAFILWLAAGCADMLELQYDPIGDVRPSTLVNRLQQDVANFKATWEPQRKGGYGPVDYQIGELAKAANAMEEDLRTKGGRFTAELEKAYSAGSAIAQLLGGKAAPAVQSRWQPLRQTLNTLVTEYRRADPAAVYAKEATPTQTLSPVKSPPDDYDKSFEIEQVQKRFGTVMKAWEGAGARRAAAPWAKALDGELAGFSSGLGELARVKSGTKAEVVPVATRLGVRADRVGALVRDHGSELPRQLVEEWTIASGWLRMLKD